MRADDARNGLASDLASRVGPGFDVIAYPRADVPKTRPRVTLAIATVKNANAACPDVVVEIDAHVSVPNVDDGKGGADDALDAALSEVLAAVDTIPRTSWTTADRGVFLDSVPAYRVKIERM